MTGLLKEPWVRTAEGWGWWTTGWGRAKTGGRGGSGQKWGRESQISLERFVSTAEGTGGRSGAWATEERGSGYWEDDVWMTRPKNIGEICGLRGGVV